MVDYTLTGSSGFLGSIIKENITGSIQTVGRSPECSIQCDLGKEIPSLQSSQVVIHSAGQAHLIPATEEQRQEFFQVNVGGTKNLLKGIEQSGTLPRAIIFISSASVYGEVDTLSRN